MTPTPATPYWRLSGFYFGYFASLGALLPFWSLYLQQLGHDAVAIGQLLALLMVTKVIAPYSWAAMADRGGDRMRLVRLAACGALLCFGGVFWGASFAWLAAVMLLFGFFWHASLPLFEAVTLNHLGEHPERYSRIRVWGSIGFIVAVLGLGLLLGKVDHAWLPWCVWALLAATWLFSLLVPDAAHPAARSANDPERRRLPRGVLVLLVASLLMQASHGPYYAFFTIHLDRTGYGEASIGALWALGVIAEVLLFLQVHRLLARYRAAAVMIACLLLAALRWLLIGLFAASLPWLVIAQLLHAASFGAFHAAAIDLVHRHFPASHQGRGQALYSSVSFGVGGALGTVLGGYGWAWLGAGGTFAAAAAVAVVGAAVSFGGLSRWR